MGWLFTELRVARADLEAMKRQAESTNAEYDRLAEEHQKLQVYTVPYALSVVLLYHISHFRLLCVNKRATRKIRKTNE